MVIATRNNHLKTIKNQAKISQKSPQVVKHVVVADFEPILSKKIADIFEAVQTPESPKTLVK